MFHLVPIEPSALMGKEWLWIERPCGETYLLVDHAREVRMPECVASALAEKFLAS